MKSILISIKPEWVAKILNGEKTIEIRKTAPKCDLPVNVYIYCTKGGSGLWYVKNKTYSGGHAYLGDVVQRICNGKVVAKFTLERADDIGRYAYAFKDGFFYETLKGACLTTEDLTKYAPVSRLEWERRGMKLYAWRISDLVIFDQPKDLSEFGLKRAPQSWQYVGGRKKGEE